jgi:hypothetical protein
MSTILLKADNRSLSEGAKFSFLANNTSSATSMLVMISNSGFSTSDYVLIGDFGDEDAEIRKISTIDGNTTITLTSATVFSHSESTKITRILYNQARFYRTTTASFSAGSPLGTVNIDPQSHFTQYEDSVNSTGYGWFIFLNETSGANSAVSNAIPYTDFEPNSAKKIIDSFFSLLNNKEAKLIDFEDAFRWLSEGYATAVNHLNMVNSEYTTPSEYPISVSSGTQEYALPSDFAKLIAVTDSDGKAIQHLRQKYIRQNNAYGSSYVIVDRNFDYSSPGYFIRGNYIGFSPSPTENTTYYVYYSAKSGYLDSYYDSINLPNNNYYSLVDFMMFRASPKLGRDPKPYWDAYMMAINTMKMSSAKQNANLDSWEPADETMI